MLACLAAAAATCAAALVAPAAAPGITVLNVTGSGCRPNTTAVALSPDRTAVTITYSAYTAPAGGTATTVSRNCRINMKIDPVSGYAPTITSVDYRGFAEVAAGSAGRLAASYRFHGAGWAESAAMRLTGPFSDNWLHTDVAGEGLVTGRCTGAHVLDVDSTLTLTSTAAGAATDVITMDSTDAVVPNTFHLSWRPCTR
ncbi:DUF4360 domain-containing protein [Paractinoplanes rishiriensis]|uniref:DUF4360 domain-containing protein n=1 Tax=Paractinoplanes rishiriensis TaxID=1050105 RepID=A0A919K9D7_9ACTN|nr:DUF4360 domain-containing protein [Actinoplanes rishiriensis]GIF01060.1 hypothetical protein Ari01nite_85240 [Actinoplanes rishiriensis]